MILSDREIQQAIRRKAIIIDPVPTEEQYTTSALDLLLGEEILELKTLEELQSKEPAGMERPPVVDLSKVDVRDLLRKYAKPLPKQRDGSFILPPGKFVLGITREYVELPRKSKIAARVEGRSTLARLGLVVHLTAPTIHAGFAGHIILEMCNFGSYSLRLIPSKLAICQLVFERLGRIPKGPVRTRYLKQKAIR
ncbi:MAG TPA: dCTP deaminase [Candidatus Acidoferrales bacterium]|nr:dCTP deaminase [Candidatus Acidoferrales bacterium]